MTLDEYQSILKNKLHIDSQQAVFTFCEQLLTSGKLRSIDKLIVDNYLKDRDNRRNYQSALNVIEKVLKRQQSS